MNKLRLAFFGTPAFSVPILESVYTKNSVVAVVSQPDKPVGKGGHVTPSAVSAFALAHQLPLFTPTSLKDEEFKQQFLALSLDIAVVVAYGKILPQWILDTPKFGAINIHASLLPLHRGASPIAASIQNGDEETGLSYIIMNNRMDEGDIIYTSKLSIDNDDTTESLANKLSHYASKDINTILQKYINGELARVAQDHGKATYSRVLSKEDGQIDFNQPPPHLDRIIRANYPWPGTWGWFNNKRVKLLPGGQVQMEGKKVTSLAEFKHGYPTFPLLKV
jgi:methionyl-tRNA formyltransferase